MVSGVTYGAGNQILSIAGILNETQTYNNLQQLTSLSASGFGNTVSLQYGYSATQNNGKIISQTDSVSGEQITYTYDALNRLASAVTSDNPNVTQWGQSYNYDGFATILWRTALACRRELQFALPAGLTGAPRARIGQKCNF